MPIGINTTTPVIKLFLNFIKILLFFCNFAIDYNQLEYTMKFKMIIDKITSILLFKFITL